MDRRSIIVVLIGAIATVSGFAITALLRVRRCEEAGAEWRHQTRECVTAAGERIDVSGLGDAAIGILMAVVLAFMLFRVLLFVMGRMPRRRS